MSRGRYMMIQNGGCVLANVYGMSGLDLRLEIAIGSGKRMFQRDFQLENKVIKIF